MAARTGKADYGVRTTPRDRKIIRAMFELQRDINEHPRPVAIGMTVLKTGYGFDEVLSVVGA